MSFVRLQTQGESPLAIVNTEQIAYMTEGIYGASIHFVSGEYLVCVGDLAEVTEKLFGDVSKSEAPFMMLRKPERN